MELKKLEMIKAGTPPTMTVENSFGGFVFECDCIAAFQIVVDAQELTRFAYDGDMPGIMKSAVSLIDAAAKVEVDAWTDKNSSAGVTFCLSKPRIGTWDSGGIAPLLERLAWVLLSAELYLLKGVHRVERADAVELTYKLGRSIRR